MDWLLVVIAVLLWFIYSAIKECAEHLKKILSSNYRMEDQCKLAVDHLDRLDTAIDRLHQDVTEIRYVSDDIYKMDIKPRKVY